MPDARIQLIDRSLFRTLIERARQSPRLRTNHNFHGSMEENPHRFLNVMVRGTYVTPHRHLDPPKAESFLVLAGEIVFSYSMTRERLSTGGCSVGRRSGLTSRPESGTRWRC